MTELFELVLESLPAAVGFALAALACTIILRLLLRKPPLSPSMAVACVYLGFLLAGTLRPENLSDLFHWTKPWHMDISFQLDPAEALSSLHALFNIALFLPWGILGMLLGRRLPASLPTLLSGVGMSLFIEAYQLFHMRSFDFGDIVTNVLGCIVGITIAIPFVIIRKNRRRV